MKKINKIYEKKKKKKKTHVNVTQIRAVFRKNISSQTWKFYWAYTSFPPTLWTTAAAGLVLWDLRLYLRWIFIFQSSLLQQFAIFLSVWTIRTSLLPASSWSNPDDRSIVLLFHTTFHDNPGYTCLFYLVFTFNGNNILHIPFHSLLAELFFKFK